MTRRPTWRSVVGSACVAMAVYVLFLAVLAPAALLDAGLRHATAGTLRLAQARGSLWSGSGRLEIRDGAGSGVGKELSWTLQPRALWRGRLDFDVAIDHADSNFPVRISAHGIEILNVDFSLPASALGIAVPRMAPLGPRGDLVFHVRQFSRAGGTVSADVAVTWKDAGSALTPVAPLGTYELRVHGAAGSLNATLRTDSGPLRLDGGGSWRGGGFATFSATARVDAQHRRQLAPLLRLIAVERSDGDFVLRFSPPLGGVSAGAQPQDSR